MKRAGLRVCSCRLSTVAMAAVLSAAITGCASYKGSAVAANPADIAQESGWVVVRDVPLVRQSGPRDCGVAALSAVLSYWGEPSDPARIRAELPGPDSNGFSAGDLRDYARRHQLAAFTFNGTLADVQHEIEHGRPVMVGVVKPYSEKQMLSHFQVVTGFNRDAKQVLVMDPADGWRKNSTDGFESEWKPTGRVTLVVFHRAGVPATEELTGSPVSAL